ncbi:MAG: bifunctional UDP-N-acetylmuramoyl-tripeptide:D-alanyl-D-alanine ligase/alanine racemase [Chitinophagales bacterium]
MHQGHTIKELAKAAGGKLQGAGAEEWIVSLLLDSRRLQHPEGTLFFAVVSARNDGHAYIDDLLKRGVKNFVISKPEFAEGREANFIVVKDTIIALQKIAAFHRNKFLIPVIGITGSNGKTMVKEWLYQLLHEDYHITRSPKSFNSQVGVPLSLWQLNEASTLGIFEAGISESGEMEKLEKMIQPTIGIITNVGEAHAEGFLNIKHKAKEKLRLFSNVKTLIYCKDHKDVNQALLEINALKGDASIQTFSWSQHSDANLRIMSILQQQNRSFITGKYDDREFDFEIPFADRASVEDAIHCACCMLVLGKDFDTIRSRMKHLSGIAMRLELKDAINNCSLINDSYNSDLESLRIAIDFLQQQQQHQRKTIILSDILQSGRGVLELYSEVGRLVETHGISRLIGIGPMLMRERKTFEQIPGLLFQCYESTDDFLKQMDSTQFQNEVILLKGARKFQFEKIVMLLEKKAHQTVLEINLNAVVNNLKVYQSLLKRETKVMAMVKAFSYGSGSFEIANVLQFHRVNYLAVAYADEGIELRRNGIQLPIMVMNPEERSFESMIAHQLEPEIYSLPLLEKFLQVLRLKRSENEARYKIHIELETGMHRLGFEESDLPALIEKITSSNMVMVASIFSHLAGSEDRGLDDFTQQQIARFTKMSDRFVKQFDYKILRHILNSNGISRHTAAQFDMVRLGIGLYGLDATPSVQQRLQPVSTLKTTISQIKHLQKGDTIGYGRIGKADNPTDIATVGIGYADGLPRSLSNGKGTMLVNGQPAPIIGNVCMDMTMLDVTGLENVNEGDEAIVFGQSPRVDEVAKAAGTIAYEILTGVSSRVKRVYFQE